jgi:hypothetical protein
LKFGGYVKVRDSFQDIYCVKTILDGILDEGDTLEEMKHEDDTLGDFDLHTKKLEKIDFNPKISSLRMSPICKYCFVIPICSLEPLPLVRPILEIYVQLLEKEFFGGYREGDHVMYVFIVNNLGVGSMMTEEKVKSGTPLWQQVNDNTERTLSMDEDLSISKGKKIGVRGDH